MSKRGRVQNRAARRAEALPEPASADAVVASWPSPAWERAVEGAREKSRISELDAIAAAAERVREAQLDLEGRVRAARRAGATWASLAAVLGVTPQAVAKKYAGTSRGGSR